MTILNKIGEGLKSLEGSITQPLKSGSAAVEDLFHGNLKGAVSQGGKALVGLAKDAATVVGGPEGLAAKFALKDIGGKALSVAKDTLSSAGGGSGLSGLISKFGDLTNVASTFSPSQPKPQISTPSAKVGEE